MTSCALSYWGATKDHTHLQTQGVYENCGSTFDSQNSGTFSRKQSPKKVGLSLEGKGGVKE